MIPYYFRIFKKLTLYKTYNYFKLLSSYYISKIRGKVYHNALPFSLSVEPTTSCNLRCPQCPSGLREFTRPTGMLDPRLFDKIIGEIASHVHSLTFYFQGEPYLNPGFLEMVKAASEKNIFTITSTNAHYMNEQNAKDTVNSRLDKLIISVDGITQDVYEQYRKGGQINKVIEGTKEIIRQKKILKSSSPHVVWQFVVFRSNEHQVEAVKKLGRELGVDEVKIKTAQIYDFENAADLIPLKEKLSRYKKGSDGSYTIKNELLNQCWRMWQACVITWDGQIVPCCFDKDAKYKLGSLTEKTFSDIWFSENYNRFRTAVLSGRKSIDICKNCSEGTKIWA